MRRWAVAIVLLGAAVLAAPSRAATVEIAGGGEAVTYVAAPGERNDLTFAEIADSWPSAFLVTDAGATITTGPDCVSVDPHRAGCVARSGALYHLRAELGDGDDVLRPAGFDLVRADGGPGDDRLLGGTWDDRLSGGGGTDELRGGRGDDTLGDGDGATPDADVLDGGPGRDWVDYAHRSAPVTVDLSDPAPDGARGEHDQLVGIENVHGGRGADRLTGDDAVNEFRDEGGDNRIAGKGGDDRIRARSGRIDCGRGDDALRGVTRRAFVEPSCETILRAYEDSDFSVRAYPRRTATGLELPISCPTLDGEPVSCSGSVRITRGAGTLARGTIRSGTLRRSVHLRLTRAGRRILRHRAVTAVVEVRGAGIPHVAWRIRLPRRD